LAIESLDKKVDHHESGHPEEQTTNSVDSFGAWILQETARMAADHDCAPAEGHATDEAESLTYHEPEHETKHSIDNEICRHERQADSPEPELAARPAEQSCPPESVIVAVRPHPACLNVTELLTLVSESPVENADHNEFDCLDVQTTTSVGPFGKTSPMDLSVESSAMLSGASRTVLESIFLPEAASMATDHDCAPEEEHATVALAPDPPFENADPREHDHPCEQRADGAEQSGPMDPSTEDYSMPEAVSNAPVPHELERGGTHPTEFEGIRLESDAGVPQPELAASPSEQLCPPEGVVAAAGPHPPSTNIIAELEAVSSDRPFETVDHDEFGDQAVALSSDSPCENFDIHDGFGDQAASSIDPTASIEASGIPESASIVPDRNCGPEEECTTDDVGPPKYHEQTEPSTVSSVALTAVDATDHHELVCAFWREPESRNDRISPARNCVFKPHPPCAAATEPLDLASYIPSEHNRLGGQTTASVEQSWQVQPMDSFANDSDLPIAASMVADYCAPKGEYSTSNVEPPMDREQMERSALATTIDNEVARHERQADVSEPEVAARPSGESCPPERAVAAAGPMVPRSRLRQPTKFREGTSRPAGTAVQGQSRIAAPPPGGLGSRIMRPRIGSR
jgi:hypothetical protein